MKTVVITGANTGIGFATAQSFLEEGHHVILACRNLKKAEAAKQRLQQSQHGKRKVDIIHLDLESLEQVASAADQLIKLYPNIDILVNNAGLMTTELKQTQDGFEKQIGVNYLGHFLLTMKLLPVIKQSDAGRIINLASMMHILGTIDVNQFRADQVKKYNAVRSYGNSKLANLLFSNALAKQLVGTTVTCNAIHPGGVDSEIYRELPKYQYAVIKLFLIAPSKPASLIKKIALEPSWRNRNGDYVSLQTPAFKSSHAKNQPLAQKLYDQTYALLQDYLKDEERNNEEITSSNI